MKVNHVSLCGRLVADPESRTINGGENVVTSFRLACTPRHYDRARAEWVDGRTTWVTVSCWRQLARNVAVSLRKGSPVLVTGRLTSSEWTTPEGRRSRLEVEAESVGIDLTFGTSTFQKVSWSEPRPARGPSEADDLALSVERATRQDEASMPPGERPEDYDDLDEEGEEELESELDAEVSLHPAGV